MLSIIIPAYNCESTIDLLLDSILLNNLIGLEIIIVNDGSNDHTENIVSKYINSHNENIVLLSKKNEGAPKARNFGLENAKGKYIMFCDADDLLPRNKGIETLINQAETYNYDIIMGDHITRDKNRNEKYYCTISGKIFPKGYNKYLFCDPLPGNKIYRHEFLQTNRLLFDDVKIGQDLNFYLKCVALTNRIGYVPINVYIYNDFSDGISRTYKLETLLDIKNSINKVEQFYKEKMIYNASLEKNLYYVKMCNYMWQLKKKRHICKDDYICLKKELVAELSQKKYFNIKDIWNFKIVLVEYWMMKHFDIILRNI